MTDPNKFDKYKALQVALESLTQTTPKIYNLRPELVTTFNLNQNSVSCLVEYTNSIPDDGILSASTTVWNTYTNGTDDTPGKDDGLSGLRITPATTSAVAVSISQNMTKVD